MRKIIFLDVDGVLNTIYTEGYRNVLDDSLLQNLKLICDATKCEIVLSSTWRCFEDSVEVLENAFHRIDIPVWTSTTPDFYNQKRVICRSEEIESWIKENTLEQEIIAVILDDENPKIKIKNCEFVQTSMHSGLDCLVTQKVIELLS